MLGQSLATQAPACSAPHATALHARGSAKDLGKEQQVDGSRRRYSLGSMKDLSTRWHGYPHHRRQQRTRRTELVGLVQAFQLYRRCADTALIHRPLAHRRTRRCHPSLATRRVQLDCVNGRAGASPHAAGAFAQRVCSPYLFGWSTYCQWKLGHDGEGLDQGREQLDLPARSH